MITVKLAECHETCLEVTGPSYHIANVNPIGMTNPEQWRVDCDSCCTCIKAGFKTKAAALEYAKQHVVISTDDYWRLRNG